MCTAYAWRRCWLMITVAWYQALCPPCKISTVPVHASAASLSLLSPPSTTSPQVLWDNASEITYLCTWLNFVIVTTSLCVFSEELTPPMELLQMIALWIQDDPRLVLINFLNTPLTGNQPISSLDVTPLGGLVRWCVKAPLVYRKDKKKPLSNGSSESEPEAGPLFSALHLSVLQVCVYIFNEDKPSACTVNVIKRFSRLSSATFRSSCCCPTF